MEKQRWAKVAMIQSSIAPKRPSACFSQSLFAQAHTFLCTQSQNSMGHVQLCNTSRLESYNLLQHAPTCSNMLQPCQGAASQSDWLVNDNFASLCSRSYSCPSNFHPHFFKPWSASGCFILWQPVPYGPVALRIDFLYAIAFSYWNRNCNLNSWCFGQPQEAWIKNWSIFL